MAFKYNTYISLFLSISDLAGGVRFGQARKIPGSEDLEFNETINELAGRNWLKIPPVLLKFPPRLLSERILFFPLFLVDGSAYQFGKFWCNNFF